MKKPNYTKEELEFLEKWALPGDEVLDTMYEDYDQNGVRITALRMAQSRKEMLEDRGIILERISDYKEDTSPIIPPKYTKEERAIIKEWGIQNDKDYDTKRRVYDINGKRITALHHAKSRKEFLEEHGQKLERRICHKKSS